MAAVSNGKMDLVESQMVVDTPPAPRNDDDDDEDDAGPDRGSWGGQLEFILTCVGFAVGLGNVWRFPYLCYQNGGGAFLIPYLLMLALVGIPMFFLELCFGQFASLGPIAIWKANPLFKGLGWAMVIVATYIVLYYNVIVGWCLYYFFASMTSQLPWVTCDNWWNTENCIDKNMNRSEIGNFTTNVTLTTPSEEYYYNYVLRISGGIDEAGPVVWQLCLLLLLAWTVIFIVLLNGINSVGKASYFVSLFPYVLLTIMLGRGASLPGAAKGIEYYMKPDFNRLADPKVWGDAATQIFYSLGCCMGGLVAMASFNKFDNNVLRDAMIIPFVNCGTSIYAGFVIFSVLGYMAEEKGVPVSEVARDGPGLVFVVYPEGLATMPVAPLWAILFFFMMTTLGFSSQFSMAEGVCAAIMDEFPNVLRKGRRPMLFRLVFCILGFLLGLPMVTEGGFYMFKLMDDFCAGYPLLIIGLLELIALAWIYPYSRFSSDITMMLGKKPSHFWAVCWCGLSPLIILVVVVLKAIDQKPLSFDGKVFPQWANALAWMVVAFPLVVIVAYMVYWACMSGGTQVLKKASSPTPAWGPAQKQHRTGKYAPAAKNPLPAVTNGPSAPEGGYYDTNITVMGDAQPPHYEAFPEKSHSSLQQAEKQLSTGLDNVAFVKDDSTHF